LYWRAVENLTFGVGSYLNQAISLNLTDPEACFVQSWRNASLQTPDSSGNSLKAALDQENLS
jgi:hypothetical protein